MNNMMICHVYTIVKGFSPMSQLMCPSPPYLNLSVCLSSILIANFNYKTQYYPLETLYYTLCSQNLFILWLKVCSLFPPSPRQPLETTFLFSVSMSLTFF